MSGHIGDEIDRGFVRFARDLDALGGAQERLTRGIEFATELVGGCDHAGITQTDGDGYLTAAATDEVASRSDQWQHELAEGPCVSAVRERETVLSLDLRNEGRWPRWAPRIVAELDVRSVLSLLLYTHDNSFGALNLYGDRANAFDSADLAVAQSVAGHLAVAVAAATKTEQLGIAIRSRTVIGQAEGVLMERLDITADQAFSYLRRVSQSTNRKLVEIADDIVATRRLPDEDPI